MKGHTGLSALYVYRLLTHAFLGLIIWLALEIYGEFKALKVEVRQLTERMIIQETIKDRSTLK